MAEPHIDTKIVELFGHTASISDRSDWPKIIRAQHCPYLERKCLKTRKGNSEIAIGTCTLRYSQEARDVIICPYRLLERRQVFNDCIHLLTLHEPGNELHVIGEVQIPGGNVDYVLVSARNRKVMDFVAIEWQTVDTTGTVWPERQRFAALAGVRVKAQDVSNQRPFGMNWKMTAKTILVQLHHKIQTFDALNKHLVLVVQDHLLAEMRKSFSFGHITQSRVGDPMHIHAYKLEPSAAEFRLQLIERLSTDAEGVARCMGLEANPRMELQTLLEMLESKLSDKTLLTMAMPALTLDAPEVRQD